jgi:hypothetical protein
MPESRVNECVCLFNTLLLPQYAQDLEQPEDLRLNNQMENVIGTTESSPRNASAAAMRMSMSMTPT